MTGVLSRLRTVLRDKLVSRTICHSRLEWIVDDPLLDILDRMLFMPNAAFADIAHQEAVLLEALGERLRLARRRRKMTAQQVALEAGITRVTLRRVEAGEPGVLMGTYLRVLATLGLAQDLIVVARDDMLGRRLQDEELTRSAVPKTARAQRIRLADYPMLREVAWSTDPAAELTPRDAFALYERNWRHIDREAMDRRERDLVEHLTKTVGKGVLLV